jgi:hypothetical protein
VREVVKPSARAQRFLGEALHPGNVLCRRGFAINAALAHHKTRASGDVDLRGNIDRSGTVDASRYS